MKEPNEFNYETEKITHKASDAAEYIELFGSSTQDCPYLTLPYNTGKTFYRLALRPLTGPMRIPELTVSLQNPQMQYSPGSIPIPGTIPLPRGGLLT